MSDFTKQYARCPDPVTEFTGACLKRRLRSPAGEVESRVKILHLLLLSVALMGGWAIAAGEFPKGVLPGEELPTELLFSGNSTLKFGSFQENLTEPRVFYRDIGEWHFTMTAVARYTLRGKLVGRDLYSGSPQDTLSPMDLSFAWGKLIEAPYEEHIRYLKEPRHLNYHYHFPADCLPLNYSYINEHSSNNHCIFADDAARIAAEEIKIGSCVEMRGYLVDVYGEDFRGSTYTWTTSRSRSDVREGACEIVWVEEVRRL